MEPPRQPRLQCTVTTDKGETFPAYCNRIPRASGAMDKAQWQVVGLTEWLPPGFLNSLPDEVRRAREFSALIPDKYVTVHETQTLPFP